jgi:hypothetical protein
METAAPNGGSKGAQSRLKFPQKFIPHLITLWQQDRFPVEKLTRHYQQGV